MKITRNIHHSSQSPCTPNLLGILVMLLAMAAGCATSDGNTSSNGSTGGTGGEGAGSGVKHTPCSPGDPCEPGKTCNNGICAAGCNTDVDCPEGQYCGLENGQICFDKTFDACPATPCAPTQVCVQGMCGTVPTGTPCGPTLFNPNSDGCSSDSLCLSNVIVEGMLTTDPVCYVLPVCSPDHPCSLGGAGAVCSKGLIADKDGVCIPGGCVTEQNCPTDWKCALGGSKGYGQCTDGTAGHACAKQADCAAGLSCYIPVVNELGTCK